MVLPHLQKIAAKDAEGKPCAQKIGTGSSGHYVKMIHNGIEHGMMAAISEAWAIMSKGLKMSFDEIADEFYRWNKEGEFRNTFLIKIGGDICSTKDSKTGEKVLDTVEDKVVQDVVGEEGTGIWSNLEEIAEHIPAPTLTSGMCVVTVSRCLLKTASTLPTDCIVRSRTAAQDQSQFQRGLPTSTA